MYRPILSIALLLCACPAPEEGALAGPGFDETTGEFVGDGGDYLVALTYLKVRNAPGPGDRFGELAQACGEDLFTNEPDGWVGGAFRSVGRLEQYTMTVWESEEQMLDWVAGEVHAPAMVQIADVSSEAKATVLDVTDADLPYSWDDALDVYAELPWYDHPDMRSE